ncbi:hypothetical protein C8R44DRAFT_744685 [Mycena epipterygia]|nr:hypothetical protein C8R44DRAFT_744685 [Mycena epipterygia]
MNDPGARSPTIKREWAVTAARCDFFFEQEGVKDKHIISGGQIMTPQNTTRRPINNGRAQEAWVNYMAGRVTMHSPSHTDTRAWEVGDAVTSNHVYNHPALSFYLCSNAFIIILLLLRSTRSNFGGPMSAKRAVNSPGCTEMSQTCPRFPYRSEIMSEVESVGDNFIPRKESFWMFKAVCGKDSDESTRAGAKRRHILFYMTSCSAYDSVQNVLVRPERARFCRIVRALVLPLSWNGEEMGINRPCGFENGTGRAFGIELLLSLFTPPHIAAVRPWTWGSVVAVVIYMCIQGVLGITTYST